ncbi:MULTISPECIES: XTP/dITP diphosphatase [Priestia]|uniref:dITP/XTP pyrophosphatase n=3 Tax=Priestia TaxID=2800373 RepID=D5DTM9_PRIM1|nr:MULTISPECIES: XTP/dITP diphosphatase [Priestia]KOP76650.1 nucleoside-triphosphate diphosphatase [Bacillus sp. FJAT-21351]KQU14409.1 non-canonical purine NTP pyrophosphatase [Bacillus sp. Leaf75]KRF57954.1 non-canonical purine NTP pyrophosphatase [Bacillus sp. Soil531]MBZ5477801.1 XTP/dITP diphosphatase [Bacillus sp. T_4]MCF6798573.1 XTP/dITP diphosphatase [Bacillus sp. ET1]MDH6652285.1 XTP/dITP diphosphohydrolase [Bacillus sp. PvP124]MDP9577626.1 XTP/dITP diphosphohydrolase [Bacillus sp. 
MREIIIATKNAGKVKDFETLFSPKGFKVKSLLDFPEIEDVEETGVTFAENATLKAEAISSALNKPVIADDSGLAIDALNGEPGVYSARYAGENKDDNANIEKVLQKLNDVPFEKRTARFHCALAIAVPGKRTEIVEGTCEGHILEEKRGENGFGYDPIFFVEKWRCSMAELTKGQKNQISHRANALKKLAPLIDAQF